MYFLRLCWKNIWRNKRRTLLTANAIGFGVMALVAIRNYYDSFHEQIVQNVIRYQSGHLIVSSPGFEKNQSTQRFLPEVTGMEDWIRRQPKVKAVSSRVQVPGLLSSAKGAANLLFMGVDPQQEQKITKFHENLIHGQFLSGVERPIVVGKTLSEILGVGVGSKVVALTQGVDGSVGNELFFVSGIFETQSDADKALVFIESSAARTLLSLPQTAAHQISVVLESQQDMEPLRDAFLSQFPDGEKVQMLTWQQVQRHVMAVIELDRAVNRLLMGIVLFVAALGIANTILMSIMERTREFGVMMAIGTKKKELIGMVMTETLLLCSVGVLVGNFLGALVTLYFGQTGFDLKWLTSQQLVIDGMLVQTISYPVIVWKNSINISSVIMIVALLVALIPVRHISRLGPVQALRAI